MTLEHGIILLKKCRPINLLSIILLQCFTYFFLFYNILSSVDISLRLSLFDLFLITLDLALIMGSGYLINDIFDIETDKRHQNKESLLETGIPLTFFRNAYWAISILGLIITLYLAQKYQEWGLSLLYPAGVFILYLYAKKLKNSILWGNIVIAILCCFPSLMLYLAEAPSIQLLKNTSENLYAVFLNILYFLPALFLYKYFNSRNHKRHGRQGCGSCLGNNNLREQVSIKFCDKHLLNMYSDFSGCSNLFLFLLI